MWQEDNSAGGVFGDWVGATEVGDAVGWDDGNGVGSGVSCCVGCELGWELGCRVGIVVCPSSPG